MATYPTDDKVQTQGSKGIALLTIYLITRPKPRAKLTKALIQVEDLLEQYGINVLKVEVRET